MVDVSIRNSYCLDRVLNVLKDKRGIVSIVTVKTKDSIIKRPMSKLYIILESLSISECEFP